MSYQRRILSLVAAAVLVSGAATAIAQSQRQQVAERASPAPEGVVNVNTATAEQLALLPGVGPSKAQAIIEARQRRPFQSAQDLLRVRGIGQSTLRRLRPYVTTSGETTLRQAVASPRETSGD